METICFLGSDKNAGKTTALLHVYRNFLRQGKHSLCLTSVGINGEAVDSFDGRLKPPVRLFRGSHFITAGRHLTRLTGCYRVLATCRPPQFGDDYVLGCCQQELELLLQGPNSLEELVAVKRVAKTVLLPDTLLLVDGSIDRQFLADPAVSDRFYFALRSSRSQAAQTRLSALLTSLQLPVCSPATRAAIGQLREQDTSSLLLDEAGHLRYRGRSMPFADRKLQDACRQLAGEQGGLLYLRGGLTSSLAGLLATCRGLRVVLDNFTLYQAGASSLPGKRTPADWLSLLHPVQVAGIFLREEVPFDRSRLPVSVPVSNLYTGEVAGAA